MPNGGRMAKILAARPQAHASLSSPSEPTVRYVIFNQKETGRLAVLFLIDASVHDETNQKLKLKPDSIRDA